MTPAVAHTLIGAYVLDAVDDVERAAAERHLAGCEACAAEAVELQATATRLGGAVAVTPPPGLRSRVIAQVRRTRQVPPLPRPAEPACDQALRQRRQWWLGVAAAMVAGVVAFGAGAVTNYVAQQRWVTAEATQVSQMRAVIAASDARLATGEVADGGRVSVVVSARRGQAVVVISDLSQVDRSHAYQLWAIADGHPISAGVWDAGARSGTRLVGHLGTADALAVTREPASGSARPTLPILTTVPLRG